MQQFSEEIQFGVEMEKNPAASLNAHIRCALNDDCFRVQSVVKQSDEKPLNMI
jgi:hypothetical protein